VLKGADPEDIIRAISGVAAGNAVFGPGVAQRAIAYLSGPRPPDTPFQTLTPREREVLGLIAAGLGNSAIAARLGVSPNTVANHISSVFAKLRVASRAEAIVKARDAGLSR
jgi:DNA-binding NarL/FixJ family response regulator